MTKGEEHRARAAQMRSFANDMTDARARDEYEKMAIAWTMLAEQADDLDRRHPPQPPAGF